MLDPHGALVDDILTEIPKDRLRDVVYLNPVTERVIGLNLFEGENQPQIVSSLISIIKNIWPDNWGPRSEWLLENLANGVNVPKSLAPGV